MNKKCQLYYETRTKGLQDMKHDVLFCVCIKFDLAQDDDDEHDVLYLYYV